MKGSSVARDVNYNVFYTFANDATEYRATVKAHTDDEAVDLFRTGLKADQLRHVTVVRISRVDKAT